MACIIVLLASKYKHQSRNGLQQRHCENKLVSVTQFSVEVGSGEIQRDTERERTSLRPDNSHPSKPDGG